MWSDYEENSYRAELEEMKNEKDTKKRVIIDIGAYRDYFPELKVGIKDDKSGKFFETRAGDVYETVISEFHDMFTRRTFEEMLRAGTVPPDQAFNALEFGANFDRRGFRGRSLPQLEFIFDEAKEVDGFTTYDTETKKERELTKEEKEDVINEPVGHHINARAARRAEAAKVEDELRKAIAANEAKLKESRRNNPNWAAVMERMQPGVYYGEFGGNGGGVVSKAKHEAIQKGDYYGLSGA